jgi:hypothetical protein
MADGVSDEGERRIMNNRRVKLELVKTDGDKANEKDSPSNPMTYEKPAPRLGREAQAQIGQQLRAMYQTYVHEGVPTHLSDLVERFAGQDREETKPPEDRKDSKPSE